MSKALEAARRAIESHPAYDCGSTGDEEMARDAISAYLSALAEDEETVERVARGTYNSRIAGSVGYSEFDDLSTNGYHDTYLQEMENARAALRALTEQSNDSP